MWKTKSNDNYVKFLDSIRDKPQIDYFDMIHVFNASNVHYYENNYHNVFYQCPRQALLAPDTVTQDYQAKPVRLGLQSQHILCKSKRTSADNIPLFVPPTKIEIDCSIQTLADFITIIDKYPYNPEVEYNIDLKNLHEIRTELVQLNNMIGLSSLKKSILNQLLYFLQEPILCENNKGYKHTVLCGPPGTGKTEIAKIIGSMYSKMGVLNKNNYSNKYIFKKVTRSDLIAGFLGQTAIKTKEVVLSCLGGCLFIDEAYSLGNIGNNDIFSKECIDTICEALSDHKDDLMVIIAGYEHELKEQFFSTNLGLESRFIWKFTIDHYSPSELRQIFEKKIVEEGWTIDIDEKVQISWFEKNKNDFKHFGRDMEQLLLHTKILHARRIYGKSRDLCKKITMEDLENGRSLFLENQHKSNKLSDSLYGLYT
jgi:SpoVK/Ycf46/Vps4 family AAA+-type ATPase